MGIFLKVLGKLPPALILTLILNQTLTLTGGTIFHGGNFPDTLSEASVIDSKYIKMTGLQDVC